MIHGSAFKCNPPFPTTTPTPNPDPIRLPLTYLPERLHEVANDGGHDWVQEHGRQVVDAQLQRPEALAHKVRASLPPTLTEHDGDTRRIKQRSAPNKEETHSMRIPPGRRGSRGGRYLQGQDERPHQKVQMREERRQSHWNGEAQLHKELAHCRLVRDRQEPVQVVQQHGQQRQKLLDGASPTRRCM